MTPVSNIGYDPVLSMDFDGGSLRVLVAKAASRINKTQALKIYNMSKGIPRIRVLRLNNDSRG
jgi:hypothetical protein